MLFDGDPTAGFAVLSVSCGLCVSISAVLSLFFFYQSEDGIRYLVRSRGLGDVYKRQANALERQCLLRRDPLLLDAWVAHHGIEQLDHARPCLLYTSDAADERSSVDLGGRRIIKKKKTENHRRHTQKTQKHPP